MQPGPPELPPAARVYRRIFPGSWASARGRPFANEFKLRLHRGEIGLSCYDASRCSPEEVLDEHPGFGLVEFRVSDLSALGLHVVQVSDPADATLGHAHVEIRPAGEPGQQIPRRIREAVAELGGRGTLKQPATQP